MLVNPPPQDFYADGIYVRDPLLKFVDDTVITLLLMRLSGWLLFNHTDSAIFLSIPSFLFVLLLASLITDVRRYGALGNASTLQNPMIAFCIRLDIVSLAYMHS